MKVTVELLRLKKKVEKLEQKQCLYVCKRPRVGIKYCKKHAKLDTHKIKSSKARGHINKRKKKNGI